MRVLLAVLAWCVMVRATVGSAFGFLGALALMNQQGLTASAYPGVLFHLLVNTGFRLIEAFALGLGLLFLLDLDKRSAAARRPGPEAI